MMYPARRVRSTEIVPSSAPRNVSTSVEVLGDIFLVAYEHAKHCRLVEECCSAAQEAIEHTRGGIIMCSTSCVDFKDVLYSALLRQRATSPMSWNSLQRLAFMHVSDVKFV